MHRNNGKEVIFFSPETIDKMMEAATNITPGQTFVGTIFAYILLGFFIVLIVSAFVKKDSDILEV